MDFTPESGTITMFSTTWCGYCNRLKKQLDAQGIGYTEINIEEVEGTADLVEQLNGGNRTVPTVLFPDGTAATNPSAAEVKSRLAVAEARLAAATGERSGPPLALSGPWLGTA